MADNMTRADCLAAQHDCREGVYDALRDGLRRKLGLWTAIVLIGIVGALIGVCFAFSVAAQAKAIDAAQAVAVQGKESESLRRDIQELKEQGREILAVLRGRDEETK